MSNLYQVISEGRFDSRRHARLVESDESIDAAMYAYETGELELTDNEARLVYELREHLRRWASQGEAGTGRHYFFKTVAAAGPTELYWNTMTRPTLQDTFRELYELPPVGRGLRIPMPGREPEFEQRYPAASRTG